MSHRTIAAFVVVAAVGCLLVFSPLQQDPFPNDAMTGFGNLSWPTSYLLVGGLSCSLAGNPGDE